MFGAISPLVAFRRAFFVSIDDTEQARLKALEDAIFDKITLYQNIIWQKKFALKMMYDGSLIITILLPVTLKIKRNGDLVYFLELPNKIPGIRIMTMTSRSMGIR